MPAVQTTFVHSWLSILFYAISAIALGAAQARSQTPGILFVQSNWVSKPATSSTVAVPFAAAQVAGDLNIVVVTWNDASAQVQAVSDTTGNIYQRAVGPTVRSTAASQSLYYALNQATAAAGANTVTVTFTAGATTPEVRVAEYSGIDPLQPLDVAVGSSGNSSSSSSGSLTTRNANDLLVGANWASGVTTAAGASFTSRMITASGDILEDHVVTAIGSYSATAPVSPSGTWIMQLAAFRAGGSPQPDLTVTKTHTGSFTQGQTGATYTLTVLNSGAWSTAGTVTVVDTLPSGLTATALSGSGWTCTLSTLACTRSTTLAAGSSYPAITLTVSVAATAPASVTNTVTVSGGGETNTANNVATDATTINPQIPDLTLTKTHTGSFTQGQTGAKYTLTARNGGTGPTSGVVTVRDTLPAGLTATALSGTNWSCTLSTLTCTRNTALAAGSSYPAITLTVNVNANAAASLTNTATVSGGGETNTANDAASDVTAITQLADLTLTKTHVGNFTRGQTGAVYSLTATNSGLGPTSGTVTVSDTPPTGLTATSIGGTGWTCTQPAGPCTRSDVLAAGNSYPSIALTVNVASNAAASLTNTATVGGGGEVVTNNDTASDVTVVASSVPDLAITKAHVGAFAQGQIGATYVLTVSNVGLGPTGGTVTVSDGLPAGLIATSIGGAGWTCTQPAGPCVRSDSLAAGAAYPSITLTANVAGNAPPNVTNTATVTTAGDINAANNTAADIAAITQLPDLTVSASHTGAFTQGQTGAAYTVTVSNAGTGSGSGVVTVSDSLPAGLTATSLGGAGWSCLVATLTCTRADAIAPGATYPVITLTVDVDSVAPPSVTNIVTVAGGGEVSASNDTALDPTTIIAVPDLVVTSTHTGSFAQGQTGARYALTVRNAGTTSTSDPVSVADVLPEGLTATALSGSGWICDFSTLSCTRPDLLAPGAVFPAIDLVVNVAGDALASVINIASVSGGGEFNTANDSAGDVTTVTGPSDLLVSSSHVGSFVQGQLGAAYTLTVSNPGAGYASGLVTVTDVLPPGLTPSSLTGSGWTCVVETLSCTRSGGLAAGATYPAITLTVTVGQDAAATVTNTVVVSGGGEANTDNDTATDATTIVPPPDLTLTKTHVVPFSQGLTGAMYSLVVTNAGGGPTIGAVTVTEELPAGLTATGIAGAGWSCAQATLSCTRNDILAAGTSYPAITVTVDVAASAPASVVNTAVVSGGGDANTANNIASDPTVIAQLPDLTFNVTHGGTFTQGQVGASYSLTVSNAGAGPTVGMVTVGDTLPAGLTATALHGVGWNCAVASFSCTRSDALAAGSSYPPITLTVDVAVTASASVTNTGSVSGGGETNIGNDSAADVTSIVQLPDLALAVTHGGPFIQGQSGASYTLIVSNTGPGPTTSTVTVSDTLPAGLMATALSGTGWNCALGTFTCTRNDVLAPGGSYPGIVLTVNVAPDAPVNVTNTAVVGGGGEINTANDTATDATAIVQPPDLIVASAHPGSFVQGQSGAGYTLTATNAGGGPTVGAVTVVDTLPAGLAATGMTGAGWNCALGSLTCTRSDLLAAGTAYPPITLTVDVTSNAAASVTNTAAVSGGGDTNVSNNTTTDPTAIVQLPDLIVSATHGGFVQGQTGASYTLTITNAGAGPTTAAVTVADALPNGLIATAFDGAGWTCTLATLACTRSDVLLPGASYQALILTVNVAVNAAASVTNTVTVGGGGETATSNDAANDFTIVAQLPDVTVVSTHNGPFVQGQTGATYTLLVSNGGAGPTVGDVAVIDTLPSGLTATAISGAGWSCQLNLLTCVRSDVLASGSSYPQIALAVTVAADAPASITNAVAVSGGGELNTANDAASDATSVLAPTDLVLTKTHTGSFTQGQTGASYSLTVTNAGGAATAGPVTVTDTVPGGLTATALAGAGWNCTLNTATCTRSDALAAGASYPTIVVTVDVAAGAPAAVTNMAFVSGGGDGNAANNTATDVTSIVQLPDLVLSLTHSGSFTQGQVGATYTLTVANAGAGATAGAVTVSDVLPAGLTATALSGAGWTCTTTPLACTRSDALAAGASYPAITLTADVAAGAASNVTNTAAVSGGGETNTANDTVTDVAAIVQLADLRLALTHSGSFVQGQTATYALLASNTGAGPTTSAVTVVDVLPAGLTATVLAGAGWNCTVASLSCTRNDALAAGASYPVITLTVSVAITAPASVTNTATVSGGGELNLANDTATDAATVAPATAPPVFVTEAHFAVDQNTTGPNRATLALTVSGTNTLLLAALHVELDGGDTNWVATDNGAPGTLLVNTDGYSGGAGNQRFRIWYWVNPPAGSHSVVIQNSYTGSNEISASAVLLSNVSQTGPLGAVTLDVSTTGRTSESETVASTVGDLVVHVIADALFIRGTLGPGETSRSLANDGLQKSSPGDGDASLWISTKPGASPTTTVSSSGWPGSPAPAPSVINGVGIVVHGGGPDVTAPTAPGPLLASAISPSQINLSWTASTDNVGVTGYRIERCQGAGCASFIEIAATGGATPTFADSTVAAGVAYSYRVRATDAVGNLSGYSNTSSATTPVPDTQAPSAPALLTSTATSSSVVNLAWSPATDNVGVVDYWVERCPGTCATGFVKIATVTGTTFGDTGLAASSTYSYVVMAEDASANVGPASNISVVTTPTPDTTPPLIPTNLITSGITNSQIVLSWKASTDNVGVAGYHVFRDGSQIATALQATYTDTGLAAATAYVYAVTAFDAAGNESALSAPLAVTTAFQQPTPTLVQHVAGGMDNNYATTLTLTLPNPTGAGNALILGVRFNSIGSVTSVSDDRGNAWLAGPTVTNATSAIGTRMDLYYALNVAPGTQVITVAFSGLAGPAGNNAYPQAVISEFYNVSTVSALDGSRSNATSRTTGSITTTAPGDLIYEWGADVSAIDYNYGIQFNGSSIAAGSGFTLLSADLQTGSADQYMVQTAAGTITPTFSASSTDTWASLAIALKSASAGTPPPLGIRVVHMQHSMLAWPGHTTPVMLAFPSSGNLLLASFTGTVAAIAGVTDGNNNTWFSAGNSVNGTTTSAQLMYAPNAVTSATLSNIAFNLKPACSVNDCNVILYDVTGATAAPYDKTAMSLGNQTSPGQATMATLTPSAANELTVIVGAITYHTINAVLGTGYVLDAHVNAFDDDGPNGGTRASRLDMDNAWAHIYTGAVTPLSFTFTATATKTPGGISYWSAVAAAFFGVPPAPDTVPPSVPVNLTATGLSATQIALSWAPSSDNVGVAGYKIYRGGSQIGTSASTAFNDTGLSAQTSYTYAVEAFDGAGNGSGQSAPISASTTFPDVTPPSVPSSLATSNVTTSAATITWAPSTDDFAVTGYQVFRNGIFLSNVATTSYTDTGLFASTTYSYAVAAFDLSGNVSVQSTPLNVTTAAVPLAPPSFVKLKEARVTSNTNSISTGSFATPVTSGNLIAVWIWYNSSTQKVSSMTDTAGNTYALAVGPTTGTGGMAGWRQELWYAKNVIGGTNLNVTATFTGMFNAEKSITAHEYSGLDQAAPLDVTAAAATSDANASTGLATTSFANELIFAGGLFQGSGSAGTGFTRRSSMASNVSEDKVVSSVGGYAGLFTNTAQAAIVQMAAFKAAGQ